jgi:hypothetical protein
MSLAQMIVCSILKSKLEVFLSQLRSKSNLQIQSRLFTVVNNDDSSKYKSAVGQWAYFGMKFAITLKY